MNKIRIFLTFTILSALLATTLSGCRENVSEENRTYFSELRSVHKLTVGRMTLSKMATIDDIKLSEAQGMKQTASAILAAMKPGSRKAAYSYDTYLRAFIDLDKLTNDDVRLSADGKTLDIALPPVEIEFTGRDMEIREEHYRVTGLRSNIDATERAALKEEMNRLIKEDIKRNPDFTAKLTEVARNKALSYFTSWGEAQGLQVNVHFKN